MLVLSSRYLAGAVLLISGCSLVCAYQVATAADAVPKPMLADTKFPYLSREISSTRMFAPSLEKYVNDPQTICTIIAPSNQAINYTMDALGQYVGLFLQNRTMQEQLLNYHVIPGQKLKASQLGTNVAIVNTRANETLLFAQHKGRPYVASGRKYVVPLEIVDIPAGGCIIHVINSTVLVPPTIIPMVEGWLQQAGNESALQAPDDLWLSATAPVPGSVSGQPATQTSGVQDSAAASSKAAPVTSAADAMRASLSAMLMSLLVISAAAAAML